MRTLIVFILVLAGASAITGCNNGPHAGAKVTGTVKLDGKALPGGSVLMESADGKFKDAGVIGADGSFTVANAPLGKVKVALIIPDAPVLPEPPAGKGPEKPADLPKSGEKLSRESLVMLAKVPAKYRDANQSGLSFEVGSSNQPYDIAISSKN